ncbi:hypothetical protein ACFQ1I_43930 [Kitasatospora arboriphila]
MSALRFGAAALHVRAVHLDLRRRGQPPLMHGPAPGTTSENPAAPPSRWTWTASRG